MNTKRPIYELVIGARAIKAFMEFVNFNLKRKREELEKIIVESKNFRSLSYVERVSGPVAQPGRAAGS